MHGPTTVQDSLALLCGCPDSQVLQQSPGFCRRLNHFHSDLALFSETIESLIKADVLPVHLGLIGLIIAAGAGAADVYISARVQSLCSRSLVNPPQKKMRVAPFDGFTIITQLIM